MPSAHPKTPGAGARRLLVRNNRIERAKTKSNIGRTLKGLLIPFLVLLGLFLFVKITTNNWNGHDKVSVAFRKDDGSVGVTVADPETPELTTMLIPGDTQVTVSAGYGSLRIKNVWQLGLNEKKGGNLLSGTVTKSFLFPVHLWSDSDAESLSKGSITGIAKFVFTPKKTNIAFGDRLMLGFFALNIKNIDKGEIDLAKSQYLRREVLNDGVVGYVITGAVSERLTSYFSDNGFADQNLKVGIVDGSGVGGEAAKVGEILEAMGGKVVSLDKNQTNISGVCEVTSPKTSLAKKIAKIFGCTYKNSKTNLDLEIKLGDKFSKFF